VNVGDDRDRALCLDLSERLGRRHVRYRAADDLAPRVGKALDLSERRRHVARVRVAHRLDRAGRPPADLHVPYLDLSGRFFHNGA